MELIQGIYILFNSNRVGSEVSEKAGTGSREGYKNRCSSLTIPFINLNESNERTRI